MSSQQLYSYLGRAALWKNVRERLAANGTRLAPRDARALKDLCAGVTWMQRVPPALLASYRALYVVLRGCAADAEEEINRDILRTVRGVTGLLLDFSSDQRGELAGSINRVLNALAHVDDMGYCQGQNYVVDVMMKAGLPERETFCLFLYLLRQGHLHGIYRKEVPMLAGYMDKFEEQLRLRLPKLAMHFEAEHYPPPLYALEWMTTLFGLAAQPLISLVALDLILAGARNPVLRLCVALLGGMGEDLLKLDQEGLLEEFRSRAVAIDAEDVIVRALSDGGGYAGREVKRSRAGADGPLGWSTGPDYLLVLRSRHCETVGLVELREEARKNLLAEQTAVQDALLSVTRSQGWGCLRACWLKSCLAARSDHDRHLLAGEALRFVITNGGHVKAAAFVLGVGGADANGVDLHLLSPLHLAGLYNRPDVARVLLLCGASRGMVGGVTRAAAARGGKLWTPLEMAEEACTEGGELDGAGVAVGPAALYVLRGLVCLQCNVKLSKPSPCETCRMTFCKSCQGNKHFCIGKLDLPRGVPLSSSFRGTPAAGTVTGVVTGDGAKGGPGKLSRRESDGQRHTLWELGSAIGDDWEALFEKTNANARGAVAAGGTEGDEEWQPGKLKRADSAASKAATEEDADLGASPRAWSTMTSVLLGTWERRPAMSSAKDRNKMLNNSAAFVRACYPAQTWLQYKMESELGLSSRGNGSRRGWGGSFRGLGIRGERFNPEVLRVSTTTELHRRMSWVMAESGVPWESSDQTWCCPECFILFSFNVYRHHCRGCGLVYCSAHAPPTPVPHDNRPLKLCWSCVLEGAAPLPSPLIVENNDDEKEEAASLAEQPQAGARGVADVRSLIEAAAAEDEDEDEDEDDRLTCCLPTMSDAAMMRGREEGDSPTDGHNLDDNGSRNFFKNGLDFDDDYDDDEDDDDDEDNGKGEEQRRKADGGFFSALVSFIEVVAAPVSPKRSRGGISRDGASHIPRPQKARPAAAHTRTPEETRISEASEGVSNGGREQVSPAITQPASEETRGAPSSGRPPRSPAPRSYATGFQDESTEWRGDWAPLTSAPRQLHNRRGGGMPPRPSVPLPRDEATCPQPRKTDCTYDAGILGQGGHGGTSDEVVGVVEKEKPVELGFPSERPWAYGFGSG